MEERAERPHAVHLVDGRRIREGELRDHDARLFQHAEQARAQAACRCAGQLLEFATPGALEAHMTQLKALDAEASALYGVSPG